MLAFDLGIVVLIALALPGEPKRVALRARGLHRRRGDPLRGRARSLADRHGAADPGPFRPRAGAAGPGRCPGSGPGTVGDLVRCCSRWAPRSRHSRCCSTRRCFAARGGCGRVVVAGAIPLVLCAAAVLAIGRRVRLGDQLPHRPRPAGGGPRREPVRDRASARVGGGSDPWDMAASRSRPPAPGSPAGSRWRSAPPATCWSSGRDGARESRTSALVTALLAILVVFSPVLSPQFLLWILPISACAFGLGAENAVLLLAILLDAGRRCSITTRRSTSSAPPSSGRSPRATWLCSPSPGWSALRSSANAKGPAPVSRPTRTHRILLAR